MSDDRCDEDVTRQGESEPCNKPAVALRIDPTFGDPYPVCAYHARAPMVPLADVIRDAKAEALRELAADLNLHRQVPDERWDVEGAGVGMEAGPVVSEGQGGE